MVTARLCDQDHDVGCTHATSIISCLQKPCVRNLFVVCALRYRKFQSIFVSSMCDLYDTCMNTDLSE